MHACSDAASHWNVDMFGRPARERANASQQRTTPDCGRRRRTAPWSYPRASRPRATGDTPSTSRRREVPPRRSAMGSTLRLLTSPTPCGRMFAKRPEDDGTRPRIKSAFSGFDRHLSRVADGISYVPDQTSNSTGQAGEMSFVLRRRSNARRFKIREKRHSGRRARHPRRDCHARVRAVAMSDAPPTPADAQAPQRRRASPRALRRPGRRVPRHLRRAPGRGPRGRRGRGGGRGDAAPRRQRPEHGVAPRRAGRAREPVRRGRPRPRGPDPGARAARSESRVSEPAKTLAILQYQPRRRASPCTAPGWTARS